MSSIITFKVKKNSLRMVDGYSPVGAERNYTVFRCEFDEGDDWDNCSIITAAFFVNERNVKITQAAKVDNAVEFNMPGDLSGAYGMLCFTIAGSYEADGKTITAATNIVAVDVIKGILINELDPDEEVEASIYEQLLAALNAGINEEKRQRQSGDNRLQEQVNAETFARTNADSQLQSDINGEKAIREAADTTLRRTLLDESTARASADTALGNRIDALSDTVSEKANSSDVYSKAQTDAKLGNKTDVSRFVQYQAQVQQELDNKVDSAEFNDYQSTTRQSFYNEAKTRAQADNDLNGRIDDLDSEFDSKADKTYVDSMDDTIKNTDIPQQIDNFAETIEFNGKELVYKDRNNVERSVGEVPGVDTDKLFGTLDDTLSGDSSLVPALFVKPKGDNYALVYADSEDVKHELFDFSNLPSGGTSNYTELENKPSINDVTLQGNKTSTDLGLQPLIGNYFTVENNEYISYNFKSVSAGANSVLYCVPFERISNFPNSLVDKISQSGRLYIFHYVHTVVGVRYLIRRIMGYDLNGKYAEFAQYCTVLNDNTVVAQSDWVELTGGGSQIVSGVVNQNGTITFTDSDGNTFTTSGSSVIGADGFSPTATVTQTQSGATVSITDKNGTTTANISNGADGQDYVLTPQDKTDIANIVLSELPTTEGVLYGNTSN